MNNQDTRGSGKEASVFAQDKLLTLKRLAYKEKSRRKRKLHQYEWARHARANQLAPPGDWRVWMILAGRGFGKTRAGAETIRAWVESGQCRRIALLAETEADARDVMIQGESGLLSVCPEAARPVYNPSKRSLTWPNGAVATTYSAQAYEQLRGPQFDAAWVDELAKFRKARHVWNQLAFSLRLGKNPRAVVTTTPRPIKIIRDLVKDPSVVVTRGSTFDNSANLPQAYLTHIRQEFEGTRFGSQEIHGNIVEDVAGALWRHDMLDPYRVLNAPNLVRVVVAVDPAVTNHAGSDETGIIVVGLGLDQRAYVLEDLSLKASPAGWARVVVEAYHRHKADRIVAEVNKGGDLVENTLRSVDPHVSYKSVHATRGKRTRAEPIAAFYEQGRVSHVGQNLGGLEEQMRMYMPDVSSKSPDRMDALVWGLTELLLIGALSRENKLWAL